MILCNWLSENCISRGSARFLEFLFSEVMPEQQMARNSENPVNNLLGQRKMFWFRLDSGENLAPKKSGYFQGIFGIAWNLRKFRVEVCGNRRFPGPRKFFSPPNEFKFNWIWERAVLEFLEKIPRNRGWTGNIDQPATTEPTGPFPGNFGVFWRNSYRNL